MWTLSEDDGYANSVHTFVLGNYSCSSDHFRIFHVFWKLKATSLASKQVEKGSKSLTIWETQVEYGRVLFYTCSIAMESWVMLSSSSNVNCRNPQVLLVGWAGCSRSGEWPASLGQINHNPHYHPAGPSPSPNSTASSTQPNNPCCWSAGRKAPPSLQSNTHPPLFAVMKGRTGQKRTQRPVQGSREEFTTVQYVCVCVSHAFWSLLYPLRDSLPHCFWSVIWVTSLVQLMENKPPSQVLSVLLLCFIHLHSI